jgi:hypothetical protein
VYWPCVERALRELDFDEGMIELLALEYGPYKWSIPEEREKDAGSIPKGEEEGGGKEDGGGQQLLWSFSRAILGET